jgi:hypothetical protein
MSARDVWALGVLNAPNPKDLRTLVEHWDGLRWSSVPS